MQIKNSEDQKQEWYRLEQIKTEDKTISPIGFLLLKHKFGPELLGRQCEKENC